MGLTQHSFDLFDKYANDGDSILELGAQNLYFGDMYDEPAKFYFEKLGFKHTSIDMNGLHGSLKYDLSDPIFHSLGDFDIVTDFGTSEHVSDLYICWCHKVVNCKQDGLIISENPEKGSWPDHIDCYHWITEDFYRKLEQISSLEILELGRHAAMGNTKDGWNVYCVMKKTGDVFPGREEFNECA
jgi:hypothetical protein